MYRTFFVFLKCTIQGGPKVDVLLIAFLYLWLKFWKGIDKYWIVPVRQLFYFHHWLLLISLNLFLFASCLILNSFSRINNLESVHCTSFIESYGRYCCCLFIPFWKVDWNSFYGSSSIVERPCPYVGCKTACGSHMNQFDVGCIIVGKDVIKFRSNTYTKHKKFFMWYLKKWNINCTFYR